MVKSGCKKFGKYLVEKNIKISLSVVKIFGLDKVIIKPKINNKKKWKTYDLYAY